VAVNHSPEAIAAHSANNPGVLHLQEDITEVNRILPHIPETDLLWASAECTNYSIAKGGMSRDADSRSLPEYLPLYVKKSNCTYFICENVVEFMKWGPLVPKLDLFGEPKLKNGEVTYHPDPNLRGTLYQKWVKDIMALGYTYKPFILNAADYGAYTSRVRYFGVFAKHGHPIVPPTQTHAKNPSGTDLDRWKACAEVLKLDNIGTSIFGRASNMSLKKQHRKPLSEKTLARIAYGIKKYVLASLANPDQTSAQFISKSYSTGGNASSIQEPLHTVRTKDCHALIHAVFNKFTSVTQGESNPEIEDEKLQFILRHFSSNKSDHRTDEPMKTLCTVGKDTLITVEKLNGLISNIYMRYLHSSELGAVTGFPADYDLGQTEQIRKKHIGNAVPPKVVLALVNGLYQANHIKGTALKNSNV
jgi:DNA (cytosine-5)-methyltransferase 1